MQIRTHVCYSEFNETITPIASMDADVISTALVKMLAVANARAAVTQAALSP